VFDVREALRKLIKKDIRKKKGASQEGRRERTNKDDGQGVFQGKADKDFKKENV